MEVLDNKIAPSEFSMYLDQLDGANNGSTHAYLILFQILAAFTSSFTTLVVSDA
jgi:hypothetical protein